MNVLQPHSNGCEVIVTHSRTMSLPAGPKEKNITHGILSQTKVQEAGLQLGELSMPRFQYETIVNKLIPLCQSFTFITELTT